MDKVTQPQLKVIGFIEKNLNIKFKGSTKEEARQFISANMEKSKQATVSYEQVSRKFSVPKSFFNMGQGNAPIGGEAQVTDIFGTYNQDRNGDIFDDEGYDHHAYADCMFSTF